jgi:hypothetical protein
MLNESDERIALLLKRLEILRKHRRKLYNRLHMRTRSGSWENTAREAAAKTHS